MWKLTAFGIGVSPGELFPNSHFCGERGHFLQLVSELCEQKLELETSDSDCRVFRLLSAAKDGRDWPACLYVLSDSPELSQCFGSL